MDLIINDRIRQRRVDFFNSFNISLKYNSIASTFSFDFDFDSDVIEQKEMACIGHFHICKLMHNGELMLTGYMLSEAFEDSAIKHIVPIGGYSLPGVLEDCQVPTNAAIDKAIANGNLKLPISSPARPYSYPLQDEGLTLEQIAKKYIAPFGIQMVIDPSVSSLMNQVFDETDIKPKDTIKQYLTELTTQKNINLTHDEFGRLVFTRVKTNLKPIFDFNVPKGGLPGVLMSLNFNGQPMHSQITVMRQADLDDDNGSEFTVTNPYVPFVFRPRTIIQSSGTDLDTESAANNALSAELKNLKLTIKLDRWDFNGKLIRPNNVLTVINPQIYLFNKTTFFIESVDFTGNEKSQTSTLQCVLPECYNGQNPKYIFAGINLH